MTTPITCNLCDKVLKKESALEGHMNKIHKNITNIICEDCGKKFHNEYRYRDQLKNMHFGRNKLKTCNVCEKSYKNEMYLKRHTKAVHCKTIVFCQLCGKHFASSD